VVARSLGAQAASEVEETLKRLQSHKGVEAILIVNHDGVPLRSTMTVEQTKKYAEFMSSVRRAAPQRPRLFARCGTRIHRPGARFRSSHMAPQLCSNARSAVKQVDSTVSGRWRPAFIDGNPARRRPPATRRVPLVRELA